MAWSSCNTTPREAQKRVVYLHALRRNGPGIVLQHKEGVEVQHHTGRGREIRVVPELLEIGREPTRVAGGSLGGVVRVVGLQDGLQLGPLSKKANWKRESGVFWECTPHQKHSHWMHVCHSPFAAGNDRFLPTARTSCTRRQYMRNMHHNHTCAGSARNSSTAALDAAASAGVRSGAAHSRSFSHVDASSGMRSRGSLAWWSEKTEP
jgi:hypothetical protein